MEGDKNAAQKDRTTSRATQSLISSHLFASSVPKPAPQARPMLAGSEKKVVESRWGIGWRWSQGCEDEAYVASDDGSHAQMEPVGEPEGRDGVAARQGRWSLASTWWRFRGPEGLRSFSLVVLKFKAESEAPA